MGANQRIERLPKWAQQRIEYLERDLAYWKGKVTQLGSIEATDTQALVGGRDLPIMLPNGSEVRFVVAGGQYVGVRVEKGELYLNGSWSVSMHPEASNAFRVRVKR